MYFYPLALDNSLNVELELLKRIYPPYYSKMKSRLLQLIPKIINQSSSDPTTIYALFFLKQNKHPPLSLSFTLIIILC